MPELTKRNKQLLKKKNPALYESMINYQPGTLFHPIVTSSGLHTLLHVPSGGEPRFIHSPADPMDEARELIAGRKFRDGEMTVLFGCGLGYLPLSIVESMPPHHKLIVVEASMDILVRACQLMDLSPLLSDERVDVLSADQTYDIMNLLDSQQLNIIGGRINKLIYPPCFELHAEQYRKVECKIENAVASIKNNYINLQRHGDWTAKNILENLLHIPSSVPITPLCDMARGMPAFVVAAGPSLDRNIDKLRINLGDISENEILKSI